MENILQKYAHLLVHYCLSTKPGDKMYLRSTTLAEPLVREVYREAVRAGAVVETDLSFREQSRILLEEGGEDQLQYISPLYQKAMEEFDTYLYIIAPYNLREDQNVNPDKRKIRQEAHAPVMKKYFERTATLDMRRSLCQYPTLANAQEAGMSLEEYEKFVFTACRLYDEDPIQSWTEVREQQQQIVDLLNDREEVHYKGDGVDIRFKIDKTRRWINSDGRTNMPSGEVYTSPLEDSVNGVIRFSYPALYMGHEVEGATLYVKDGYVEKWEATRGKDFLDQIFQIEGARRFGEAAIGTNYRIQQMTKNILFDEKIGGTVHMAIGQSYLQAGGKNQSTVHWDMITDMTKEGEIYADGEKIYEKGKFLFL
ncbi:aminopeptidase [Phaeodactylibacter xiamenensis]|jgi:aminopeptidase|uniref:aminopeptidase n=1 Tax=Phaeodactylibacter xiamenensis TaxID=1524460 RepID=UPI0024A831C2|nr:aminopeptidase [Phaeodactylibacter xiamenensis]